MKTQKLIDDYKEIISELDIKIEHCYKAMTDIRSGKGSVYYFDISDAVTEIKIASAKRQLIIQFCKDIESLD